MKSLKATAEPVLSQAVALFHSSLGQWILYLVATSQLANTLISAPHVQ